MTGKVWLIGAGPSDVGLFTIKGEKILKEAQVVVYDALVGKAILAMIPKEAEQIYVGKRSSHHAKTQEEINEILVQKALEGKKVVRLKGGDPFLFGRGGEEIERLLKDHIPYEVVPGVTSAVAVPAYAGIPVTHRDYCSSVHIITGHRRQGQEYDVDFEALVRTGGTLVFLMGLAALPAICENLIKAGMKENMPVAVLSKGTTAAQKKVIGTLCNIVEKATEAQITPPAIIVVGKVCSLSENFSFMEGLLLSGHRFLVTRPKSRGSALAARLREKGGEVLEIPAIETVVLQEASAAIKEHLQAASWIVLTSPSGAEHFFDVLREEKTDIRSLTGKKIAVLGRGTKKAVEERGIYTDYMPDTYEAEALGNGLVKLLDKEDKVLIPRAKIGNPVLPAILKASGADVFDIPLYDTVYQQHLSWLIKDVLAEKQADIAVFASASSVRAFANAAKADKTYDWGNLKAACIGRQTHEAAAELGMQAYTAKEATMESLLQLAEDLCIKEETTWI